MGFPTVAGRSLAGDALTLPDDFPSDLTLAVVAFRQPQQACVDRWIAMAEAAGIPGSPLDLTDADRACVVEIPVISTRFRLGRSFIDGGMASTIRVPRILARTITVYTNVRAFQDALGISNSDEVQACVVQRTGDVLARVAGEPTPDKWDRIAAVLMA